MSADGECRREFESQWSALNYTRAPSGEYESEQTSAYWVVWQAAWGRAEAVGAHTHRWNVEEAPGGGIAVCRGHHDGGECEWEYFYPRDCGPDAADARRYRMLRDNFDGFDAGHGEPPRYVLTFQFPPGICVGLGDRFDAAIDEALRAGGEVG